MKYRSVGGEYGEKEVETLGIMAAWLMVERDTDVARVLMVTPIKKEK